MANRISFGVPFLGFFHLDGCLEGRLSGCQMHWYATLSSAAYCKTKVLESRPIVGLSLFNDSMWGSSYPKITSLALGLCVGFNKLPSWVCSIGFQVSTHLERRIWSWGIWLRAILRTVSVDNQEDISFSFAFKNSVDLLHLNLFTSPFHFYFFVSLLQKLSS